MIVWICDTTVQKARLSVYDMHLMLVVHQIRLFSVTFFACSNHFMH